VGLGIALGAVLTLVFFHMMREAFYSITMPPWTLILPAALLWIDGILAALFPALRACRVAPSVAARSL
jgi:hypothetical protein